MKYLKEIASKTRYGFALQIKQDTEIPDLNPNDFIYLTIEDAVTESSRQYYRLRNRKIKRNSM